MFRKELMILGSLTALIFVSVAGISWYATLTLQRNARLVAQDTLPGLVDSGAAISRIQENWLSLTRLLNLPEGTDRIDLARQIQTNSTEQLWQDYGKAIYSEEDRRGFEQLMRTREFFLQQRERFLSLLRSGRKSEAASLMADALTPAYQAYVTAARETFLFNCRMSAERGDRIIRQSRLALFSTVALSILLFLMGCLLGFRFAVTGFKPMTKFQRKVLTPVG
jgi:hypothetical protein